MTTYEDAVQDAAKRYTNYAADEYRCEDCQPGCNCDHDELVILAEAIEGWFPEHSSIEIQEDILSGVEEKEIDEVVDEELVESISDNME